MKSAVVKRSIKIDDKKTSVSLENEFWHGLKEIAEARQITLSHLVDAIKAEHRQGNLSSAIRVHVLSHYREK
jgi:predicted DNA-binding ribbon-helix-helix protein